MAIRFRSPTYPKHILEAMEKDKPSKDPIYWAKKGCKDCSGRGIVGRVTQTDKHNNKIVNEQLCNCVKKAFSAWQQKWFEEHSSKPAEKPVEMAVSALSPDMQRSPAEERIERIDSICAPLKEEVDRLKMRLGTLASEFDLPALEGEVTLAKNAVEQAKDAITTVLHEADLLDSKAAELYTEVKNLRQQAELLRTTERSNKALALGNQLEQLHAKEQLLDQGKAQVGKETHRIRKKIRELEDKLDRLEERRDRVLKEHGLDPVITEETAIPS